jgi:phosphatidylglycerol:prolipoprotein diacylglycerol transferase
LRPVLFHLDGLAVPSYGIFVALGVMLGVFIWMRQAPHWGFREGEREFWWMAYALIGAGFVGGKLLAVVEMSGEHDMGALMWNLRAGFVYYGSLLFSMAVALLFFRLRGYPLAKVDFLATGTSAGHAVARLGCFLAGCCHGTPTSLPWGIRFTHPYAGVPPPLRDVPLHPTQLLEVGAELATFLVLKFYFMPRRIAGRITPGIPWLAYLVLYGTSRFFIEFLRGDVYSVRFGPLTVSQGVALVTAVGALAAARLLVARRAVRKS